ncbi:hypothetical protein [Burkholderia gladioli]|uniref:hypothetical protein n=1 Tax=Burkholderia gladioli TaxID=28095 RepID=UPI0034DB0B14
MSTSGAIFPVEAKVSDFANGDPNTTYTSVQQAAGTQTDIAGGCLLLSIQGGVAQIVESGKSGCNYSKLPIGLPVRYQTS